jgi:hypothetical protein
VELYLHSAIHLHNVKLNYTEGQLYLPILCDYNYHTQQCGFHYIFHIKICSLHKIILTLVIKSPIGVIHHLFESSACKNGVYESFKSTISESMVHNYQK